jgi:hypothetical protein
VTSYTVTKVRKQGSIDGTHHHIEGVITDGGIHYTRHEVVASIKRGHTWKTSAGGFTATISTVTCCHRAHCYAMPYLRTNPNSSGFDNLENLPEG